MDLAMEDPTQLTKVAHATSILTVLIAMHFTIAHGFSNYGRRRSLRDNCMEAVMGKDILRRVRTLNKQQGNFKASHELAQDAVSCTISTFLFLGYALSTWALRESTMARLYGITFSSYWAVQTHAAYTCYELGVYAIFGKDPLMVLHHILVIIISGGIAITGRLHFYASWAGVVEGTNPCLSGVFVPKRLKVENPWVTTYGILLFVGFLFLRVLSLPCVFWSTVRDTEQVAKDPALVNLFLFGQATVVVLWLMSSFWFLKIAQGMMKALQESPHENTKKG